MIYFSFCSNQSGKFKPFQYKTEPLMVSALFPFIAPAAICRCAFTLGCTFRYNVVGSFFPLTSNVLTGACFIHTASPSKQTDKYPSSSNKCRPYGSHISVPFTRAHPFRYAPHSQLPVKLLLPMDGSVMRLDKWCVALTFP
ncbi:T. congolense-specific, putative cell surface-expressed gene family [Trypanosoma congolense IL3000]|uniref:T. congolense-specific, putative cell surface-expressed gene family n=1 Tax=Trypanosoma congolense (strain IL3000) TaxID=1068625 RepID=F9WIL9_TRYCI|nr:T. congolense-specific, putative cell surface-expressed gene family [Trypanosoma congolense IL3000]